MSINSSLVKLADKIDTNGKSSVSPEYRNPNNSIEKSLQRIADTFDASHKSSVTPEYRNPNNSIERSLERIADTYTSGGGGGGDDTFDVLFEIDPQTPSARLVKGHFSDFDLTTPVVKVGAYWKPFGTQLPNVVFSLTTVFMDSEPGARIIILVTTATEQDEHYYALTFMPDDTVEIEETTSPFPSPMAPTIVVQKGANSSPIFITTVEQLSDYSYLCETAELTVGGKYIIADIRTDLYDADGKIINGGITFNPADAGYYTNGKWVITKNCSITYDPLPPA